MNAFRHLKRRSVLPRHERFIPRHPWRELSSLDGEHQMELLRYHQRWHIDLVRQQSQRSSLRLLLEKSFRAVRVKSSKPGGLPPFDLTLGIGSANVSHSKFLASEGLLKREKHVTKPPKGSTRWGKHKPNPPYLTVILYFHKSRPPPSQYNRQDVEQDVDTHQRNTIGGINLVTAEKRTKRRCVSESLRRPEIHRLVATASLEPQQYQQVTCRHEHRRHRREPQR